MRSANLGSVLLAAACCLPGLRAQESPALERAAPGKTDLLALAEKVMGQVAELRGMPFRRPVAKGIYTREQLEKFLLAELEKELPDGRAGALERAYGAVGLLPEGVGLRATMARVLLGQVGGFYDPEQGAFHIMEGRGGPEMSLVIMAHELAHALDDQYFDLAALTDAARLDSDREFAVGSVVEGSATVQQMRFMVEAQRKGELGVEALLADAEREKAATEAFFAEPALFAAMLVPRYTMGMLFLARGRLGAVAAVEARDLERAMADPARSSEQILHPQKYWDPEKRDDPVEIVLPPASRMLGEGWHPIGRDTLGEILCALLARPESFRFKASNPGLLVVPGLWTNAAAMGWGGDRIQVYENRRGEQAVIWCSAWDTEADAEEFLAAYRTHRKGRAAGEALRGKALALVFGLESERARIAAERCLDGAIYRKVQVWEP